MITMMMMMMMMMMVMMMMMIMIMMMMIYGIIIPQDRKTDLLNDIAQGSKFS